MRAFCKFAWFVQAMMTVERPALSDEWRFYPSQRREKPMRERRLTVRDLFRRAA